MLALDVIVKALSLGAVAVYTATIVPKLTPFIYFTWHPFFMLLGFVVFMTAGVSSYVSNFGQRYESRDQKRSIHGIFQILGGASILIGYLAIYLAHWSQGKSHVKGPKAANTIHIWLGYLTLVLVAFQMFIGLRKYLIKARDGKSWAKWHGLIGPFIYILSFITICFGIGIFCLTKKPDTIFYTAGIIMLILVILVLLATLIHVFLGNRSKRDSPAASLNDDEKGAVMPSEYDAPHLQHRVPASEIQVTLIPD